MLQSRRIGKRLFHVSSRGGGAPDESACSAVRNLSAVCAAADIQQDCQVEASLVIDTFAVLATVTAGDSTIAPAEQTLAFGEPASFTITPAAGWVVDEISGDTCQPIAVGGHDWEAPDLGGRLQRNHQLLEDPIYADRFRSTP